jgi:hypothetical protein
MRTISQVTIYTNIEGEALQLPLMGFTLSLDMKGIPSGEEKDLPEQKIN